MSGRDGRSDHGIATIGRLEVTLVHLILVTTVSPLIGGILAQLAAALLLKCLPCLRMNLLRLNRGRIPASAQCFHQVNRRHHLLAQQLSG